MTLHKAGQACGGQEHAGAIFLVFSIYYARANRITPIILAHLHLDVWATVAYLVRS